MWWIIGVVLLIAFLMYVNYWFEMNHEQQEQRGMREGQIIPDSVAAIIERQPERIKWCDRCQYEHHPYMPCVASPNSICANCGKRGHFECFYD